MILKLKRTPGIYVVGFMASGKTTIGHLLAAELGWTTAEVGRQPWTIDGILPTALSVSSVPAMNVAISVAGFVILYSSLFCVEMFLMVRAIRKGPGQVHAPSSLLPKAPGFLGSAHLPHPAE